MAPVKLILPFPDSFTPDRSKAKVLVLFILCMGFVAVKFGTLFVFCLV